MSFIDFNDYVPKWAEDAACVSLDPELWFPPKGSSGNNLATARRICSECPVRIQCLEDALANPASSGIWGGTTAKERQKLRQQREAA